MPFGVARGLRVGPNCKTERFVRIALGTETLTIGGDPVVSREEFSAVVVMVIVTTMLTPPALKWSLGRKRAAA